MWHELWRVIVTVGIANRRLMESEEEKKWHGMTLVMVMVMKVNMVIVMKTSSNWMKIIVIVSAWKKIWKN
jgi:hypothetical protein